MQALAEDRVAFAEKARSWLPSQANRSAEGPHTGPWAEAPSRSKEMPFTYATKFGSVRFPVKTVSMWASSVIVAESRKSRFPELPGCKPFLRGGRQGLSLQE
ncbi:Btb/Poz Domain-Containing Protein 1 [Manis pentadactyla]|nr:Btb/Poz Domain-Containing Protein 1 [Manis pentadactyla]